MEKGEVQDSVRSKLNNIPFEREIAMQVSDLVDPARFPAVARFMETQVEMQFGDLRVLLQLPTEHWQVGCNFAAANTLLNLVSGFSVCFMDAGLETRSRPRDRGKRFKRLLDLYYPWDGESWPPGQCSKWLYDVARNPLAHSLGIQTNAIREWGGIAKRPLSPSEIALLETTRDRPEWLGPTLIVKAVNEGEPGVFLSIPGLYWGIWRLLENLCADQTHMEKAETLMGQLGYGAV